jgi:hypothetical protein
MSRIAPVLGMLLAFAIGAAGCAAMSEEEQCTRSGGVWQETFYERPAR